MSASVFAVMAADRWSPDEQFVRDFDTVAGKLVEAGQRVAEEESACRFRPRRSAPATPRSRSGCSRRAGTGRAWAHRGLRPWLLGRRLVATTGMLVASRSVRANATFISLNLYAASSKAIRIPRHRRTRPSAAPACCSAAHSRVCQASAPRARGRPPGGGPRMPASSGRNLRPASPEIQRTFELFRR